MNFREIMELVIEEYNTRNLASDVRYKALDKFDKWLRKNGLDFWNDVSKFPSDKNLMKYAYSKSLDKNLNAAESSMINEVYNQLKKWILN